MDESDVPFAPGRVLAGRYRIEGRIARGGMADVFAATDPVLSRRVAIKAFRSEAIDQRRIDREMRMLASLQDPGLVTVFDAGVVRDSRGVDAPFLVMELIDGPSLADRLKGRRFTQREIARIGAEIASTLVYVHKQGIVHRDIKPANILLEPVSAGGFRAKLADFGIARLVDSTRLTMVGAAVGTANYVSPEQALGEPVGPPSDIYSLALILIECMTGSAVYPGSGVAAVSPRLHRDPAIPAGLSQGWASLLEQMTARNQADRPTSSRVADALAVLASPRDEPTAVIPPSPPTALLRPKPTSSAARSALPARAFAVTAGVVGAAILAFVVWSAIPTGDAPTPTYPTVNGQVGVDIRELEGTIP